MNFNWAVAPNFGFRRGSATTNCEIYSIYFHRNNLVCQLALVMTGRKIWHRRFEVMSASREHASHAMDERGFVVLLHVYH